ncbi:MAG: cyclopropane-fatty-acyl-phospholipid synthase family protein, partial [Alphaproteobacteria bacterium]
MNVEQDVAAHYTHGSLEKALLDGLAAAGKDLGRLRADDLSAVDEFHIGGRPATVDLAELMDLKPGMRLLDVGCGIGGPSRYFAGERGAHVTGIDLTDEYVRAAASLSRMVGLGDRT